MADSGTGQRELVFCHSCNDEWYRDEHGLRCSRCESEAVEIVDPNSDPRATHDDATEEIPPIFSPFHHLHRDEDALPYNPLHTHNPWDDETPDSNEGDIDRVQYTAPDGRRITRISVRSGGVGPPIDPFGTIFSTLLGGLTNTSGGAERYNPSGPGHRSPLQEGPLRQGGFTSTFHTTHHLHPRDTDNPQMHGREFPVDDLSGILHTLLRGFQGSMDPHNPPGVGGPNAHISPLTMITRMFNPANAQAGDAVYTQEAMDRVISQLMEQHSTSSAPGPAAPSAIAALPKTKLKEDQLDTNGKAECSICMDNLTVGDEVTELPCKHWFHGECVGAWLSEHDTCPQCRRGIMPKEGDGRSPRTPGQVPRHMQPPWGGGYFGGTGLGRQDSGGGSTSPGPGAEGAAGAGSAGLGGSHWTRSPPGAWPGSSPHSPRTPRGGWASEEGSGSRQNPYRIPESPAAGPSSSSSRPQTQSRRPSEHSSQREGRTSSSGGGITGWMGRHFGSGSH